MDIAMLVELERLLKQFEWEPAVQNEEHDAVLLIIERIAARIDSEIDALIARRNEPFSR